MSYNNVLCCVRCSSVITEFQKDQDNFVQLHGDRRRKDEFHDGN